MSLREAGARRRRALPVYIAAVLAWTVAFLTALVLLPPSAHTTAVAHADSSSVTVPGPAVWDPAKQTSGARGTITVSQTQNLVDQMIHVSWTGFTPSTGGSFVVVGQSPGWQGVNYPVVVYECRGTNPKITDCYGSYHYGQKAGSDNGDGFLQPADQPGLQAPDFPSNEQAAVTAGDGTGSLDFEVYTGNQAPTLGCDATHQCSIVVEPNYGGDALGYNTLDGSANCADHSADPGLLGEASDSTFGAIDGLGFQGGEQCAWKNHTVIPISFAPVPGACPAHGTDLSAEGMPMLDRALTQWVVGACLAGNRPVSVDYASDLTEPLARHDFLAGRADLAFTSLPADPSASAARPYTYVPVGNQGIAITFMVDDPVTNLPIRSMKLNARLLAKLLTQSYDLEHIAGQKSDTASVAGNPMCLYNDPEFQALNPAQGFTWPSCPALSGPDTLPIVMGGKTDMVRELTSWILSDPDARAFLNGTPDQWHMHVDSAYLNSVYPYPVDSFVSQDASGPPSDPNTGGPYDPNGTHRDYKQLKSYEWNPIQDGLDDVLRHLLTATPTCIGPDYITTVTGGHPKCSAENPGARGVIAIMDTGRAAAFSLPTAALVNAAGTAVTASPSGMAAAAADYVTDPKTGTQSLNWGVPGTAYAGDHNAYPLTVPAYAMAPTSGLSPAKAGTIADFLTAVTDGRSGQYPGTAPGQLAPGYVANTPAQAARAGAAVAAIRAAGTPGGGSTTVTATATGPANGVTGSVTTSGTVAVTPITVVHNGTTTVYKVTSTITSSRGRSDGGGTGGSGGGGGDDGASTATGGSTASGSAGSSSSKSAAGAVGGSGPVSSLSSSAPAAAIGTAPADTAGPARYLLPTLLVIGVVLVAAGPVGLALTAPGGLGARIRGIRVRPRPARRFGK